ncbi:hypothetical protein EVAR_36301_1 [Eumeta japonica]|uniref:Uncharacterized protein n=1 Tax=Eumeta variegata TaxID=151549 RepID=A0A4C1VID5_EUMVA|nr:hypothetical protein EVAR_36301_1 [Eumeta japonica]
MEFGVTATSFHTEDERSRSMSKRAKPGFKENRVPLKLASWEIVIQNFVIFDVSQSTKRPRRAAAAGSQPPEVVVKVNRDLFTLEKSRLNVQSAY